MQERLERKRLMNQQLANQISAATNAKQVCKCIISGKSCMICIKFKLIKGETNMSIKMRFCVSGAVTCHPTEHVRRTCTWQEQK